MHAGVGQEDIDLIVATDAEEILGISDWVSAALEVQRCHAEPTLVILNEVKNLAAPHVRPLAEFTLSTTLRSGCQEEMQPA